MVFKRRDRRPIHRVVRELLWPRGGWARAARYVRHRLHRLPDPPERIARGIFAGVFTTFTPFYGFHFFTGFLTVIPVAQDAADRAFGMALLGEPLWQLGGIPEWVVYPMEIGFMSLGLLGSWLVAWSIADENSPRRVWGSFVPWAVLHLLLYASAMWIMTQPMDMRGTFLGG